MGDEIADVSGRVRRNERAERRLLARTGHEPSGYRERVPRRKIRVHACERAEPLVDLQFGFRTAGDIHRVVMVLSGLLDKDSTFGQRAANLDARLPRGDPDEVVQRGAADSKSWFEMVHADLPTITRTPGLNDDESGRETPEFDFV